MTTDAESDDIELTLQPYDWKIQDGDDHLTIMVWCLDREL